MKSLPDRGGWYHEHFLRGKPSLLSRITISSRDTHHRSFTVEPDLHLMPPVSPPGDPPQPQPTQTAVNSNDDACANPIDSVDGLLSGVKKKAGMTRGLSGKKHCNKEILHHQLKQKEGDKQARALYQYQGYHHHHHHPDNATTTATVPRSVLHWNDNLPSPLVANESFASTSASYVASSSVASTSTPSNNGESSNSVQRLQLVQSPFAKRYLHDTSQQPPPLHLGFQLMTCLPTVPLPNDQLQSENNIGSSSTARAEAALSVLPYEELVRIASNILKSSTASSSTAPTTNLLV